MREYFKEIGLFDETLYVLAKAYTASVIGVEAFLVEVEVDISYGLPGFSLVGLPDGAVKESKERLRAAIKNGGYDFPTQKITVNLAPADVKKEGTGFDLPIAAALLAATGVLSQESLRGLLLIGELSLDGQLKPARGILPIALKAQKEGFSLGVPWENAAEAALVKDLQIIPARSLSEMVEIISGRKSIEKIPFSELGEETFLEDLTDICGQEHAKRALEIAAAGGHNLLFIGPPGSGKTMLARRLPTILPPMSYEEALETSRIYSVAGLLTRDRPLLKKRPFRAPHHSISDAGLIGGGSNPRPGEVSLAHNGVLFLDELPEFRRNVLEALRQPLEEGLVTIARSAITVTYPARFCLIAAMNPCKCGYFGDRSRPCQCSPQEVRRYRNKISGPLLDRIDLHVEVPTVKYQELGGKRRGETSATIRRRVEAARTKQLARFGTPKRLNAHLTSAEITRYCYLNSEGRRLLEKACERLRLSARAYHRILKVARTIADLEGTDQIQIPHLLEAIQYRALDRPLL